MKDKTNDRTEHSNNELHPGRFSDTIGKPIGVTSFNTPGSGTPAPSAGEQTISQLQTRIEALREQLHSELEQLRSIIADSGSGEEGGTQPQDDATAQGT
jgi:hypothetical protein